MDWQHSRQACGEQRGDQPQPLHCQGRQLGAARACAGAAQAAGGECGRRTRGRRSRWRRWKRATRRRKRDRLTDGTRRGCSARRRSKIRGARVGMEARASAQVVVARESSAGAGGSVGGRTILKGATRYVLRARRRKVVRGYYATTGRVAGTNREHGHSLLVVLRDPSALPVPTCPKVQ